MLADCPLLQKDLDLGTGQAGRDLSTALLFTWRTTTSLRMTV
jgi:hypothetical protein